ncbi:hypothetical protein LWN08_004889 [Salmonella enterica]|nr:hypothetical protein [Salmonella enterica]EDC0987194.1 hypothetical protein [Salmonella enterica subsp. enterica serovar Give]EEK0870599.1 hypothetical protein [Salmonella enterica subsp. enterica serovar Dublin]ELG9720833.1 hypothetical protein [Salmonella enterica subsp. enterica serovar Newbrunswick]EBA1731520.1 hypothetical protein [Salmonella enterica]
MSSKNSEAQQCVNTNRASMSETVCKETNMNIVTKNELTFQEFTFNPVMENGAIWLTSTELAKVLGYKKTDAISQIYSRNSDEFTTSMTMTLKMSVVRKTGVVDIPVRAFSLRGAHLISMFANTPVAKEFRRWVLDILDREVGSAGADRLPTKFHQRVMLYLDTKGDIINTYPLNKDQVVMSFDAFVSYFRKKGWIVAPRDEVAKGIMGAIQVLS